MMPKTTLLAFLHRLVVLAAVRQLQKLAEQDFAVRVVNMRFVKPRAKDDSDFYHQRFICYS